MTHLRDDLFSSPFQQASDSIVHFECRVRILEADGSCDMVIPSPALGQVSVNDLGNGSFGPCLS